VVAGFGSSVSGSNSGIQLTGNTGNAGGDGSHNNVQPSIVLNYIIYTGT
jgi:microcystin-dependent protein